MDEYHVELKFTGKAHGRRRAFRVLADLCKRMKSKTISWDGMRLSIKASHPRMPQQHVLDLLDAFLQTNNDLIEAALTIGTGDYLQVVVNENTDKLNERLAGVIDGMMEENFGLDVVLVPLGDDIDA